MESTNTQTAAEPQSNSVFAQLPAITRKYQLPSKKKAIMQMVTTFGPFLALWVAMYLLIDVSIWLTLGLALLNGLMLVRIFIIQHDCGHQSFTASKKANDVIGLICSVVSFMPYRYWAKSHNFHHGHNGLLWEHRDIGDINLLTVDEYRKLSPLRKLHYRVFRSAPILFIIGPAWYLLVQSRLPIINLKGWEHARRALMRHNLLLVAVHVSIVLLLGYEAFLWVHLPTILVFAVVAVWFFYVQHQHETTYKQWRDKWDYVQAAIKGSTYYRLPRIMHWFTGTIGYHHIHHLNPLVPNYELARCHHENPVFEKVANSITFWQSLRCVFNKLWDEDQQRMISFREYMRLEKKRAKSA